MSDEPSEIDEQIGQMRKSAADYLNRCYFASACQRNAETARFAKGHQKLLGYIYARFHQMDQSQYVLDPKQMRECAIGLIPLLEDEERARAFQPDFDDGYYEDTKAWMTACLYENLAEATGLTDGYNSEGMHQCIADGLQVCRRTGKLACISCFREYATDVYTAADDATMARHQCQTVIAHKGEWSDRGDRRWFVSTKAAWLNILEGKVNAAVQTGQQALELTSAEEVSLKLESKLRAMVELDTALILAGKVRVDWSNPDPDGKADWLPPKGEWPVLDLKRDLNDALDQCCRGDYEDAIGKLTEWDQTLNRQHSLTAWFDVRLRLIAACRLAGQSDRIARLADQLRDRATKSADFLTLRRLKRLLDEAIPVTPIAALETLDSGPFAGEVVTPPVSEATVDASTDAVTTEADAENDHKEELTEFEGRILQIVQKHATTDDESQRDEAFTEFLSLTADKVEDARHASMLLHFSRMLGGQGQRDQELWAWAEPFEKRFSDSPGVLSLFAALGNVLRFGPDETLQHSIDGDRIEKLFRLAMSINPDSIGAHLLAGEHFLSTENHGEAERCLARSFRLDRTNAPAALHLAEVYHQTDRQRDALAVLDLCLREGGNSANVAWEALVQAVHAGQFEAALTYADRFDELQPDDSGVNYYRATAFVELGRHEEALEAICVELKFEPQETLHLDAVRACALLGTGQADDGRVVADEVLNRPFGHVTFLTRMGIGQILELLWKHTRSIGDDDSLRQRLRHRLLATGLMPDSFFDQQRDDRKESRVNFYQVLVEQSLPAAWSTSLGCMPGQGHWSNYRIVWGVLAEDESQAQQFVLEWQNRCEDQPCKVVDTALDGEGYRDKAGVVWQGMRWSDGEEEDD